MRLNSPREPMPSQRLACNGLLDPIATKAARVSLADVLKANPANDGLAQVLDLGQDRDGLAVRVVPKGSLPTSISHSCRIGLKL